MPRYWRSRVLADGTQTYWHEPAGRDRHAFPPLKLNGDKAHALLECERRNAELDKWRAGLAGTPGHEGAYPKGSVGAVVMALKASRQWSALATRTRQDYAEHLGAIERVFGRVLIKGLTRPVLMEYREKLTPGRQGNYRIQVLRVLLGYAYDAGEIESNPARGLRGFKLAKRDSYWHDEDVATWLRHAPAPMRLALMMGLYTGQRQGDVLKMRWTDIKDGPDGRAWLTIRQEKTGKKVSLPVAQRLATVLAATPRRGIVILLGERGAPYTSDGFRTQFHKVTGKAGTKGLAFLDLRRSAVVRLAEAGCTVPEIASITGHSVAETQRILDTYWVATRPQAAAAIAKLERHENERVRAPEPAKS